jgi:hypothetical protein
MWACCALHFAQKERKKKNKTKAKTVGEEDDAFSQKR